MPDGKHEYLYNPNPNLFSSDGRTFTLSHLDFYQGEMEFGSGDCQLIKSILVPDAIQTNGKSYKEIIMSITTFVKSGRLASVRVFVPDGRGIGVDYDETFII